MKMAACMSEENTGNFIKILNENVINIREMCNKYKQSASGIEEFAQRSLDKLEKLENTLNKDDKSDKEEIECTDDYVKECLQLYSQVLLDVTFCEENILVDGIFPEKTAKVRVHKLLSMLRQPEVICQHCFVDKQPKDLLGEEILECLLWRRGALLYMYCHTVQEDTERLEAEKNQFLENCKNGSLSLSDMLQVRKPMKEDRDSVVTNSEEVYTLLKNGVFSETHVLSMIYLGELCYWHIKHGKTDTDIEETPPNNSSIKNDDFNPKELGSSVLHTYLEVVKGPLKSHGWSTERAENLLEFIEKDPSLDPQPQQQQEEEEEEESSQ